MKKVRNKKLAVIVMIALALELILAGCSEKEIPENKDHVLSENIIITETGELMDREQREAQAAAPETSELPEEEEELAQAKQTPPVPLVEPEQEQVITEEDQTAPRGNELQLVFLGDSIFDNNRDGTGVPFLTAEQCKADVYNLAIGGMSAAIEEDESTENEKWTSTSFVGMVKVLEGNVSGDIFQGTRAGELLNNPDIDFSQTDYFIVEYGTNDFFRGVRRNDPDDEFNMRTYAGALRYGVCNLCDVAPDATIILCSPMYAQFYHDGYMIGDGNITNNGNGTLFDYKGTCNAIANETQVEFFNAYQDLGIDGYTADEYLEDGVHLSEAGRRLYADALAKMILRIEETKNN